MKKMSKLGKSVLLSSLAILAFGGIAAGTTYALFTDSQETAVTVTAGKVQIQPTFTAKLYSPRSINLDGSIAKDNNDASTTRAIGVGKSATFKNGGKVTVTDKGLQIENMTAGDKVTLTVNPKNLSTVKTKYRQRLVFDKDSDFKAIMENVKISENSENGFNTGVWQDLSAGAELKPFDLTIEIPTTAKGGIDKFGFSLFFDAIQGNANVVSSPFVDNVFNLDNIILSRADHGIEVSSGTKTIEGNGVVSVRSGDNGKYAMAVSVMNGATAIINGGYFTQDLDVDENSQWDMIYCQKGKIEINGGTFKSATPKWTLNCLDSAYADGTAKIVVKGGKFYKYNPAESMTEPDGVAANFVADGYKVVQDGDWYEVVKDINEVSLGVDDKLTDQEVNSTKPNVFNLAKGGTYETYGSTKFKESNVSFVGSGSPEETTFNICSNIAQTGEGGSDYSLENSIVSFENVTISDKVKNGDFRGIVRARSLSFTNCIISGRESYWGDGDVHFKDCVFEDTGDWNMWAYSGKKFVFDNCTFETSKGAVNAYKTSTNETTELTFNNCNFELVNATSSKKPIIQIGEDNGDTNTFIIHLNHIQVSGDFATGTGTYIGDDHYVLNKNNKSADHCVVYVDGVLQA